MTCGLTLDGGVDAMARSRAIAGIGAGSRDESAGNRAGTFESGLSMVSMGDVAREIVSKELKWIRPIRFHPRHRAGQTPESPKGAPRMPGPGSPPNQRLSTSTKPSAPPASAGWRHRLLQARFPPTAREFFHKAVSFLWLIGQTL